jgi:hypothetical protein
VKALIATPVAAVVLPDAQARNAKLENTILRWRAEHATVGASNIGGGRRHAILPNGRQAAEEGLTVARTTATRRSVHPEANAGTWRPRRPDRYGAAERRPRHLRQEHAVDLTDHAIVRRHVGLGHLAVVDRDALAGRRSRLGVPVIVSTTSAACAPMASHMTAPEIAPVTFSASSLTS